MKRITKFQLGSYSFKVKYVKTVLDPDTREEILGLCDYLDSTIYIATYFKGQKLNEDSVHHSFMHEVVHCVLGLMGEGELNKNEKFVDTVGLYLSQFYKSSK